ncbi:MAG: hypothetical protein AAGI72_15330 [Pseudomonadota bacterium]
MICDKLSCGEWFAGAWYLGEKFTTRAGSQFKARRKLIRMMNSAPSVGGPKSPSDSRESVGLPAGGAVFTLEARNGNA